LNRKHDFDKRKIVTISCFADHSIKHKGSNVFVWSPLNIGLNTSKYRNLEKSFYFWSQVNMLQYQRDENGFYLPSNHVEEL
jgi:hypothetical protein